MKYYFITICLGGNATADYFFALPETNRIDRYINDVTKAFDSVKFPCVKDNGVSIPRLISVGNPIIISEINENQIPSSILAELSGE